MSGWCANDDSRETMKHILNLPPNTRVEFKSHDSAIQQRLTVEESRHSKRDQHDKRGHRSSTADETQRLPAV